ncbi:MAG: sugar nucleotide-binding protein, partial [Limibacillus sp.]
MAAQVGDISAFEAKFLGRPELDVTDSAALERAIAETSPDILINATAYTAVDRAEDEPDLAMAVNADALGVMGRAAAEAGCPVIHVSTDYVFDGAGERPYRPDDPTGPRSVYGASKLAGERALADAQPQHIILRTAWLYSAEGQNFMNTMLRLAETRDSLAVVEDQRGCPTLAEDLAEAILTI